MALTSLSFYIKLLTCCFLGFSIACNNPTFEKPVSKKKEKKEEKKVNKKGEVVFKSGLKYKDIEIGNGSELKKDGKAKVHYDGYLTDGTPFDSSYKRNVPFEVNLKKGGVIQGWLKGLPGMKVGGIRRLVIPSELGYGSTARPKIPANSTLIFEIKLLEIQN